MSSEYRDERLVCRVCYGDRFGWLVWKDPNTDAAVEGVPEEFDATQPGTGLTWCRDCKADTGYVGVPFVHSRACSTKTGVSCFCSDSAVRWEKRKATPTCRTCKARGAGVHGTVIHPEFGRVPCPRATPELSQDEWRAKYGPKPFSEIGVTEDEAAAAVATLSTTPNRPRAVCGCPIVALTSTERETMHTVDCRDRLLP